MVLENYYYWFKKVLPESFCRDIIRLAKTQNTSKGLVFGEEKKGWKKTKQGKKLRDSDIVWLRDEWIFRQIYPVIKQANKAAGWNFDINTSESIQFTIYGKNQHYGWHTDCRSLPYDTPKNPNIHGKLRKLSTSIILNDPSEYKGGEFEIEFPIEGKKGYKREVVKQLDSVGSVLVFPSFVKHRVRPVTSGKRYSAVLWYLGSPWK
tara:strand:- start:549 stop:1166 length:618 start_codon:yes stop_codon:yes gene_type:complete